MKPKQDPQITAEVEVPSVRLRRGLTLRIGLVIVLFTAAVFALSLVRTGRLLEVTHREQAQALAQLVAGVAELGAATPASEECAPTMLAQQLTSVNKAEGVSFRLTSPAALVPAHSPDAWEREQMQRAVGAGPAWRHKDGPEGRELHWLQPLVARKSCLGCHASHGFKDGQVAGAVVVKMPLGRIEAQRRTDVAVVVLGAVLALALLIGLIHLVIGGMARELEDAEGRLRALAVTDVLTGLWNRRHMVERLEQEFLRARRVGSSLATLMIDVDHFKGVNDRYGHAVGDQVLKEIARRLQEGARGYDLVGRLGGEEFVVVLPEAGIAGAAQVAERVRQAVAGLPLECGSLSLHVTVSVGVAALRDSDDRVEAVLGRADAALYRAKAAGRNRVIVDEAAG